MKDIFVSSESQQTKTILLVDTLEKTLKSQSEFFFLIEVLLGSDVLQQKRIGKELQNEAGK